MSLSKSKLLANIDRWADAGVYSWDVIDLAMLELSKKASSQAFEKAESAYGDAVKRDVRKAVDMLKIRSDTQALVLDRLKRLAVPLLASPAQKKLTGSRSLIWVHDEVCDKRCYRTPG